MALIIFLYLALIFVMFNLIVQLVFYLKDATERLRLKIILNRQIKPKEANIKFAKVGKARSS